jgi:monoamine oxidase
MDWGGSPAVRALRQAQAVAAYARRTGCGIDEAADALADPDRAEPAQARPAQAGQGPGDTARAGHGRPGDRTAVSRRTVLGGAGAAALAAAVPAALLHPPRAAASRAPRVVIIGSGLAGLGCAYRLWTRHGIRSDIYEYNPARPGGRVFTLRGFYDGGQYAEQHAEFISSEHAEVRWLAARFGLHLDNVNAYPLHTRAQDYRFRFDGRFWPQAALNRDWHEWGWRLFHDAAVRKAPWPTRYDKHTAWGRRWDHMPATEWIERYIPGGLDGDFGALCVSVLLDEYGGPVAQQSALNLVYLLGLYDSSASGLQPKGSPQLSGTDEKWHIRGGNDQLISGLVERLPAGTVHLGERLVAVRARGHGRYAVTLSSGQSTSDQYADHVVLALPFTKLRDVELHGIELPPRQLRAIREEPMGANAKIGLQFSSRVWNTDHWTGNMYTDGVVQGGWETTVDQPGAPGILIALPGGEAGGALGPHYGLTSYQGPAPDRMVRDFLGCFERNFPGASRAYNGKAYYAWSAGDPHTGGAYSYLKTGQYTGFNGIQGRRHGGLHFAGEHTSLNFQGYLEGALRSGYRCAAEITSG